MLPTLAVFSIAVFMIPALCCQPKEYETRDGQCCPMCHEGTVVRRDCTLWFGTRCVACVKRTFVNQPNGLTKCFSCTSCDPGTVVWRDCTRQYGTQCVACANGTFMNQPNGLTKCLSCTSCDPGQGLQAQQRCTATADTLCDVVSGYYCTTLKDTGCSSAKKHQRCRPGHRTQAPGTSRTDTVCESCPPGYFSPDGVNCTVWTTCSETEVKAGNTSSDVVCGPALRQRYGLIAAVIFLLLTAVVLNIKIMLASKKKKPENALSVR